MRSLYPLPAVTNPPDRLCVTINIPDEPGHRQAFLGAIASLTYWFNWQRDEDKRGKEVADVWAEVFWELLAHFHDGCTPDEGCRSFSAGSGIITYAPQNPFSQPSLVPAGYLFPPFSVVTDTAGFFIPGLEPGDVVLYPTSFPWASVLGMLLLPLDQALQQMNNAITSGLPRLRISMMGAGTIEVHFLNIFVPLVSGGGLALIRIDEDLADYTTWNVSSWETVDLNKDLSSVPGETDDVVVWETEITEPGPHHIDITFIPVIDIAISTDSFRFGGGIRKVVLCGFDEEEDVTNPCCPEEILLLQQIRDAMRAQGNLYALQLELMDDGTIESFAPEAPGYFDADAADTTPELQASREGALCDAVQQFAVAALQARVTEAAGEAAATAAVMAVLTVLTGGGALVFGAVAGLAGILTAGEISALTDEAAIREAICCMYRGLRGQAVTYENFSAAMSGCGSLSAEGETVANILRASLAYQSNFRSFVSQLGQAMNNAVAGSAQECECCTTDRIDAAHDYGVHGGLFGVPDVEKTADLEYTVSAEILVGGSHPCPHGYRGASVYICGEDGAHIESLEFRWDSDNSLMTGVEVHFANTEGAEFGYIVGMPSGQPTVGRVWFQAGTGDCGGLDAFHMNIVLAG